LVSTQAMQAASQVLSAPSLLAIVPTRGWLLICAGRGTEVHKISEMHELALQMMAREERDRCLSKDVFFWENGTLIGHSVSEASSSYISLGQPQASAWSV
jgi:hypothetical protein